MDGKPSRLFIGLPVGEEFYELLQPGLRKLKISAKTWDMEWLKPNSLHLTLNFLGETDPSRMGEILEVLGRVGPRHPPFFLEVRGIEGLPNSEAARVLCLKVQKKRELLSLQEDLATELEMLDFPRENRVFLPHLTVARLRNLKGVHRLLEPVRRKAWGSLMAKELVLFESHLGGKHAVYKALGQIPLSG